MDARERWLLRVEISAFIGDDCDSIENKEIETIEIETKEIETILIQDYKLK